MNIINQFKTNTSEAVIDVTKKTFIPLGLTYLAVALITSMIMIPIFMKSFGMDMEYFSTMMNPANMMNEELMQQQSLKMAENLNFGNFGLLGLAYLAMFVIMSWFLNFAIKLIHTYATTGLVNFSQSLSESLNSKVFKTFLFFITLIIIVIILEIAVVLFAGLFSIIHPSLGVLAAIIAGVFMSLLLIKFSLAQPIIVLTEKGIFESLKEAYDTISFKKALKYLAYLIVGSIVYFILLAIVMVIASFILSSLGGVGIVLSMLFQAAVGSISMTLMLSLLLGVYYKYYYLNEQNSELELEDNLIE